MIEKAILDGCGATIAENVRTGIAALPEGDKEALNAFGIEHAVSQCTELLKAGVPGLHVYTMDRCASVLGMVKHLRAGGLLL